MSILYLAVSKDPAASWLLLKRQRNRNSLIKILCVHSKLFELILYFCDSIFRKSKKYTYENISLHQSRS